MRTMTKLRTLPLFAVFAIAASQLPGLALSTSRPLNAAASVAPVKGAAPGNHAQRGGKSRPIDQCVSSGHGPLSNSRKSGSRKTDPRPARLEVSAAREYTSSRTVEGQLAKRLSDFRPVGSGLGLLSGNSPDSEAQTFGLQMGGRDQATTCRITLAQLAPSITRHAPPVA